MYIFSVSCWDAGRRIHPDCLKLHSRHRGSRAHLRVKRPPAQSVSRGPNKERETRRLPHWHAAVAAALVGKHELNAKLPEIIRPFALCWLHVK